jgi:4-amino-4-deoxy-L-arabinose transferase-like glycosyltransferase
VSDTLDPDTSRVGKVSLSATVALLLILSVAAVLRVWGLDYGIPQTTARPDEERIVERAYHMLATGTLHPGHFAYPSLLKYLSVLALGLYYSAGKLSGDYQKLFDFLFDVAVLRPGLHYHICRVVSVGCGVATAGATYLLARQAHRDRVLALVAASALAVCYLHVRDSHFATVDVAMTLFVTLSLLFAVRAAGSLDYTDFLLAGLFAGLAASTKYNGGFVLVGSVVAGWLASKDLTRTAALGRVLIAGLMCAAAFALTSPYAVLEYRTVIADMRMVSGTIYRPVGESALWTHLAVTLPSGLGWPLFLASLAGVGRAIWLRRSSDWVLLAFAIPFLALISSVNVIYPRYCVPLLPVLMVTAAESLHSLFSKVPRLVYVVAFMILIGPSLSASIRYDGLATRRDTRLLAMNWVAEHVAPQSEILICRGYGAPEINHDRRRPPAFRPELIDCTLEPVRGATARYLITHEHPYLSGFSRIGEGLRDWLEAEAEPLAVFDPFRKAEDRAPYFYPHDAFYIPFTGLGAVDRGGPVVRIWRIDRF